MKNGNKVLQTPDSGGSTDEAVIKEAKQAAGDSPLVIDESTEVPTTAAEENTDSYGTTV